MQGGWGPAAAVVQVLPHVEAGGESPNSSPHHLCGFFKSQTCNYDPVALLAFPRHFPTDTAAPSLLLLIGCLGSGWGVGVLRFLPAGLCQLTGWWGCQRGAGEALAHRCGFCRAQGAGMAWLTLVRAARWAVASSSQKRQECISLEGRPASKRQEAKSRGSKQTLTGLAAPGARLGCVYTPGSWKACAECVCMRLPRPSISTD